MDLGETYLSSSLDRSWSSSAFPLLLIYIVSVLLDFLRNIQLDHIVDKG